MVQVWFYWTGWGSILNGAQQMCEKLELENRHSHKCFSALTDGVRFNRNSGDASLFVIVTITCNMFTSALLFKEKCMWKNNAYASGLCADVLSVFVVLSVQTQAMVSEFSCRTLGCSWPVCLCGCCAESWSTSVPVKKWPRTTMTLSLRRRWVGVPHPCCSRHTPANTEHTWRPADGSTQWLTAAGGRHFKHQDQFSWNFDRYIHEHKCTLLLQQVIHSFFYFYFHKN